MIKCMQQIITMLTGKNKNKSILNFDKKNYGEECPICLEIFDEYDDVELLCTLKCGHSYHKKCLSDWLFKDSSCPTCRIIVSNDMNKFIEV
jgi:hypothetical protein